MKIIDLDTHPKAFVTVAEFVEYTEIPRRTLYHCIDKGSLAAVKMGGSLKIPIAEARRFVKTPARTADDLTSLCATGT